MVDDSSSDREPVEVLAEEFLDRLRLGERPSMAEYKERYPELADDIDDLFPALAMMDEIDPSSAEFSQSVPALDATVPKVDQLGDYRIIREVGRGGMGVVYEAEQVSLGRHVALKVLPSAALPDDKHIRRFEREAKSAAKLHHTNIVPVFGVGAEDDLHYYVMQFIQGLPLDEVIDELKQIRAQPSGAITAATVRVAERGGHDAEREYSVTDMARSLITGQFAQTFIGESDSDGEVDDAQPNLVQAVTEPSPQAVDTTTSKLSETLTLSGSFSGSGVRLGISSSQSLQRKPFTYWESVANIGFQVADAMQYAHDQGILHRDIKPSNLLIDMRGTAWVTDFGLAKATDQQDITHTGDILGTLRYMPPEAFEGIADARSDVYSLGLTLYELLCFQPAFGMKDRNRLIKQVTSEAAPRLEKLNPEIPRDLVTIVHKAIDRDPSHRYQNARELQDDLQRFLDDEPIRARRISTLERLVRWSRRNKGLAASTFTIATLVLILAIGSTVTATYVNQQRLEERANAEAMSQLAGEKEAARIEEARLRRRAQDEVERHRQSIYGADMQLAGRYWADEDGSFDQVDQILAAQVPVDGQVDLREFSWRLQWGLLHRTAAVSAMHNGLPSLAFTNGGRLLSFDDLGLLRQWHTGSATTTEAVQLNLPDTVDHHRLSPDGSTLAVASSQTVRLFDVETTQRIHEFETPTQIVSLMYSHDSGKLGAIGVESDVTVWDVQTGLETVRSQLSPGLNLAPQSVRLVALSADGARLIVAQQPRVTEVSVYDLGSTEVPEVLRGHSANVNGLAWLPDKAMLATASGGGDVVLWDTTTWTRQESFLGDLHAVRAVAFSTDGKRLATGSALGTVNVFDLESLQVVQQFKGHSDWIQSLSFSPDDRWLASGSVDGAMRLWSIVDTSWLQSADDTGAFGRVEFSPDGRYLAAAGTSTQLWNVDDLQSPMRLPGRGWAVAFSGDARILAMCDADSGSILLWSLDENRILETWDIESNAGALRFSPDGAYLVAGIGTPMLHGSGVGSLRVWSMEQGREVHSSPGHSSSVTDLEFSPDSRVMITAGHDGELKLWNTSDWSLNRVFANGLSPLYCVEFSPDGNTVAAGDQRGNILLWNLESRDPIDILRGHANWVIDVAFSADGRTLVSTSADRSVRFWNLATGMPTNVIRQHDSEWVTGVAFAPDDSAIVTAAGQVRLSPAPAIEEIDRQPELLHSLINRANRADERGRQNHALQIRRELLERCSLAIDAMTNNISSESAGSLRRDSEINQARRLRAMLYFQFGEYEKCAMDCEQQALPNLLLQAECHCRLGDWARVSDCLARFSGTVDVTGENGRILSVYTLYQQALLSAAVRNRDQYHEICRTIIEEFGETTDAGTAQFAAWTCALAPDAVTDSAGPVQLAEDALESESVSFDHRRRTLGALYYRSGRFDDAMTQLSPLESEQSVDQASIAYGQYFLAMTHFKLDNQRQAEDWLQTAIESHEQEVAASLMDPFRDDGLPWMRHVSLLLLRREAEMLINDR